MDKITLNEITLAIQQEDRLKEALARSKLLCILKDQETFWLQRSRLQWIQEGDRNTTFFHRVATTTRTYNHIKGIFTPARQWVSFCDEIVRLCLIIFKLSSQGKITKLQPSPLVYLLLIPTVVHTN